MNQLALAFPSAEAHKKLPSWTLCVACGRKCGGSAVRHRIRLILPGRRTVVDYCFECRDRVGLALDRAFDALGADE